MALLSVLCNGFQIAVKREDDFILIPWGRKRKKQLIGLFLLLLMRGVRLAARTLDFQSRRHRFESDTPHHPVRRSKITGCSLSKLLDITGYSLYTYGSRLELMGSMPSKNETHDPVRGWGNRVR